MKFFDFFKDIDDDDEDFRYDPDADYDEDDNEFEDEIIIDDLGQEVHRMSGPNGVMYAKHIDGSIWLSTGEQYCPDCHIACAHKDGYWECDECKYSITDEEAENGDGYPTEESTFEWFD